MIFKNCLKTLSKVCFQILLYHQTVLYVWHTGFSHIYGVSMRALILLILFFTKSLKLNTCTNFHPEFDAVVSKTNACTWSARRHCCAMANMAFSCSCGIIG